MAKELTKELIGTKVIARHDYCVGIVITSQCWQGEIIKVNKKSFIVRMNHYRKTFGKRVEIDRAVCSEIKYTFVKTLSNGKGWYRSEGSLYGSIDL